MHGLIDYVCDELDELERKVDKGQKLSMTETQYMDTLAHAKKNLMKCEEMDGGYSGRYMDDGRSYARDRRGRYSSRYSMAADDMVAELHKLMDRAPDEQTKREFKKFISTVEMM